MVDSNDNIKVEIIYALPDEQDLQVVDLPEGSTVKDVILTSKILDEYKELNLDSLDVGIFGKATKMTQVVRAQDRVEIYRPLIADPKEVRKRRAAEGKKLKKGGAEAKENQS